MSRFQLFGSRGRWSRNKLLGTGPISWKPSALRPSTHIAAILISWGLIATLQILLIRSRKHGGVMVADTFDDFTLAQLFSYRYLPTIIALIISLFWNWIDIQIKRTEPYYQLSKPDGAWGKDSLLLSYPFDFLPFVPMSSLKRRHWAVFWASLSTVFITWGVVPLQAGLFATESITRTSETMFSNSEGFIPASKQPKSITSRYIDSAHGIIWLNETLPPFMARDYVVAPVKPQEAQRTPILHQNWTADTLLYSLDMSCEIPAIETGPFSYHKSKNVCKFSTDYLKELGNQTIVSGVSSDNQTITGTKQFSSVYVGYYSTDFNTYYLEGEGCPKTFNHTFMALFTRNKNTDRDPPQPVTRLYCTPFYYQQEVTATIEAITKRPFNVIARGEKQALPAQKWNSSFFEHQMGYEIYREYNGDSLPLTTWPDQQEMISTMPVTLSTVDVLPMAGFILGASNYSLEQLLDPEALRIAYEVAYRIIFARSMIEILDQDFSNVKMVMGSTSYMKAAVVVVPVFTYIVQGLLGIISLFSIALLIISVRRKWILYSDPTTIASVMALVSDNPTLLEEFSKLDRASMQDFEQSLKHRKYQLVYNPGENSIREVDSFHRVDHDHGADTECSTHKPLRPREFRSFMVVPFVGILVALAITLGVFWAKAQPYGIVRPSDNTIIRQIVENYIPTALATLIEPVWVLVNRLLCTLQPLEELRGGKATVRKSIDADYSSLPPQLVIFRALRSSHFKLAAVCTMALLSNLLAVAFSGMFNEAPTLVPLKLELQPPYQSKVVTVDGTVGPHSLNEENLEKKKVSGAYTGGIGYDQFLAADSNYTMGTAMPAWTDAQFFYAPFANNTALQKKNVEGINARTTAIGSQIECSLIDAHRWTASLFKNWAANFTVNLNGVHCEATGFESESGASRSDAVESLCDTGKVSNEYLLSLRSRQNASLAEQKHCARWTVFGYVRDDNICSRQNPTIFNRKNAVFLKCRSSLVMGEANVLVDRNGQVQHVTDRTVSSNPSAIFLDEHFSNNASNLLQQGNSYILQFQRGMWHNQSFAHDFMNYFMIKQSNSSRLVDPNQPIPSFEEITRSLYPVYSKLFAIWLGINKDKLLLRRQEGSTHSIEGQASEQQTRIFLSLPLFIIAQSILGIYIIVAICIYVRRPGRFLLRMPTSIGAIIALFAASEAVQEMRGTSLFTKKERREYLEELGETYGYGTFIGKDGRSHEGIEKEPIVNVVPLPGVLRKLEMGWYEKVSVFNGGRARSESGSRQPVAGSESQHSED